MSSAGVRSLQAHRQTSRSKKKNFLQVLLGNNKIQFSMVRVLTTLNIQCPNVQITLDFKRSVFQVFKIVQFCSCEVNLVMAYVSIVTGLQSLRLSNLCSIPGGSKTFFLSRNIRTGFGVHSVCYTIVNEVCFPCSEFVRV